MAEVVPNIGEIILSRLLGYKMTGHHIYAPCITYGKTRWVQLVKGKPRRQKCRRCLALTWPIRKGPDSCHWKGNNVSAKAGRKRARNMFPLRACDICGQPAERHHRDGDTLNNVPSNIAFLCRKHHMKIDGRF